MLWDCDDSLILLSKRLTRDLVENEALVPSSGIAKRLVLMVRSAHRLCGPRLSIAPHGRLADTNQL